MQDANKSLDQFAGIASHDLKAPLRQITQYNKFILEDYADREAVEQHVGRIRDSSRRLNRMIDSLLEFTRSGFSKTRLARLEIEDVITDVVKNLQPDIMEVSAKFTLQVSGQVYADRELLERVFYNLFNNSIKYAKSGIDPVIHVEAQRDGDIIRCAVADNGIGIDPQYSETIFKPLQRLHASQNEFEGSGIGLSLVKSVIEAHGGRIWLDTKHTDGCRIEFELNATKVT